MSIAQIAPRQMPLFEGFVIEMGQIAFGGTVEIPLSTVEDQRLIENLRLGRKVDITIEIAGQRVAFEACVDQRVFGLRRDKDSGDDIPWTRCKLKVLDDDSADR